MLRLRATAIVLWSFWWDVAAMSATKRSIRPSLFTSPRSDPIDEKGMCGTTESIVSVKVPSLLL